jgi:hypothetical protein
MFKPFETNLGNLWGDFAPTAFDAPRDVFGAPTLPISSSFGLTAVNGDAGDSISTTLFGLAKTGADIFGAAAPMLFATDRAAAVAATPASYRPGGGMGGMGGSPDLVTWGLMGLALFAAWRVLK